MPQQDQKAIIYTSQKRSLYVGRLERTLRRVNVSSILMVSMEDELELINQPKSQNIHSKSLLIPAGMNFTIDTHNCNVAWCFLDDLGTDLKRLSPYMKEQIGVKSNHCYYDFQYETEMIDFARFLTVSRPSTGEAFHQLEQLIASLNPDSPIVTDTRVAKAIAVIKEHCDQNLSVTEVAKQVNLSVSRLMQLFKQVTGSPIRRFRLWHRFFIVAARLTEGYSLTDAAIDAGFSDYAHFSRVYREFGGASAGAARVNTEIRVLS